VFRFLKRFLVGTPLPTHASGHQRLGNLVALAVFASDALSSTAYATEEILWVFDEAGGARWFHLAGLTLAVLVLLVILVLSYGQTIAAYPKGGGSYIVAKENLGRVPSLVAGAALLIDYTLTAAVSVAAGIAAIVSALPALREHRIALAAAVLLVIVIMNLRGVKESGRLFAVPTYAFIASMVVLAVWGFVRIPFFGVDPEVVKGTVSPVLPAAAGGWLLMRAFASGCSALTGVEAISDGVPAFRPPEADNAKKTLAAMGVILGIMFLGVSALALVYHAHPSHHETVLSQIARQVFGSSPLYYVIQTSTALILILAANTAFADFPRLASFMAKDGYLPRQLANQGDRLAYSNGIVVLGVLSWLVIAMFGGQVHSIIPLYAVGVFLSFTISQSAMVAHWSKRRAEEPKWRRQVAINLTGAIATGLVLAVVIATKFTHGAWLVCGAIPVMAFWFTRVHRHYVSASKQLKLDAVPPPRTLKHTVIIPVAGIHKGVLTAVEYARSLTSHVRAVTVRIDDAQTARLEEEWKTWAPDVPLIVLDSPYRSLIEPLVEFLDKVEAEDKDDLVTVVVAEFVPRRLWHRLLHNQTALILNAALSVRPNIVVTTVRIPLDD